MRSDRWLRFSKTLFAAATLAAAPAQAQSDTAVTLAAGGEAQTFSGTIRYNRADRYFFVAKKDTRLIAHLSSASPHLVLAVVSAEADPADPAAERQYATELAVRLPADGRYAVAVLFHPRRRFVMAPPPAPYRLQLRME